jgi:hypothetical protein
MERQVDTERFHTRLALIYVDKLFNIVPAHVGEAKAPKVGGEDFAKYKKKLETFLDQSENYRVQAILDRI